MFSDQEILKELPHFETFFARIGLKRIDGSIFGLLVLSKRPLTSEEIEATLNLSQSAVSLSLKTLTYFGAIETLDQRENSKARVHTAKEDSLSVVASVFRKREEEYIAEFKLMAQRVLEKSKRNGVDLDNLARLKRMQSIINTCEIAQSVMNFVITIVSNKSKKQGKEYDLHYENIMKRLPLALDLIAHTAIPFSDFTFHLKESFNEKIKNNFKGLL